MCVQVTKTKLPGFSERVMSEFIDSNLYKSLKSEEQKERYKAVLRSILLRNEKVRRRDLSEVFVKGGGFVPNELTRILKGLTYAMFIDREDVRTPAKVVESYYRVHRDRVVLNDCTDDLPAVARVVRLGDSLSIVDEQGDHERDVRRVMGDLPPGERELKAQLQDYLNRQRTGRRAERKKKEKNKKNRQEIVKKRKSRGA